MRRLTKWKQKKYMVKVVKFLTSSDTVHTVRKCTWVSSSVDKIKYVSGYCLPLKYSREICRNYVKYIAEKWMEGGEEAK